MTTITPEENLDVLDEGTIKYLYGIPLEKLPKYSRKDPVGDVEIPMAPEINKDLLIEILNFIKKHPRTWRQTSWYKIVDRETGAHRYDLKVEEVEDANTCGTSFCFAGHVALHEGFPLPPALDNSASWSRQVVDPEWGYFTEEAWEFACKVLGLEYEVGDVLFQAENSLEDLEFIVRMIVTYPEIQAWMLEDALSGFRYDENSTEETVWNKTVDLLQENYPNIPQELVKLPV